MQLTWRRLKKSWGAKYLFKTYYVEDLMVGFASSVISETQLEAHFIGVDYAYNYDYEVYQTILYDFVNQGILYKMQTVNYGRTAMEIKSNLGAKAGNMSVFIKHRNPFVNWLISPLFQYIRKTPWTPRNPYKNAETVAPAPKKCKIKNIMNKSLMGAAVAAPPCWPPVPASTIKPKFLMRLKTGSLSRYWRLNPSAALYAGYHKYDTAMVVPSLATIADQYQYYQALLDSLHRYKAEGLNDNNKIDLMMLENQLQAGIWYNNSFKSYEWNPSEYNVGGDFAQIISEHYDKLDEPHADAGQAFGQSACFLRSCKTVDKESYDRAYKPCHRPEQGAISVFEGMLNDSLNKSELSDEEKIAIKLKADAAKNAIIKYVEWLEKDVQPTLNPATARSFRIGKDLFAKKFEFDIVSGYSADQVYAKALKRKQELHGEMYKVSKSLWSKYFGSKAMPTDTLVAVKMMIDTLSTYHVNRDSIIVAIKRQRPELVNFINQKNLLYIDPSKPLVVRETPLYMRGVAGASVSSPRPLRKSSQHVLQRYTLGWI